jgi:autotransporter-associated beta strand protein
MCVMIAGAAAGFAATQAVAQGTAARANDGPSAVFPSPVSVQQSLDLRGTAGADGIDGLFGPDFNTAWNGGDGGDGGSLTLQAGWRILLTGTQAIMLDGGAGGNGGVARFYLPLGNLTPPPQRAAAGRPGLGGNLTLAAPTTVTLSDHAVISGSGSPGNLFSAVGARISVGDFAQLWGFTDMQVGANSTIAVRSLGRLALGGGTLALDASTLTASDIASVITSGISLHASTLSVEGASVRVDPGGGSAPDLALDASQATVAGGSLQIISDSGCSIRNASAFTLAAGSVVVQGYTWYDEYMGQPTGFVHRSGGPVRVSGSTLTQLGGSLQFLKHAQIVAVSGASIDLLGGVASFQGRTPNLISDTLPVTAIMVTDSVLRIGQGSTGPSLQIRTPAGTPAIDLTRGTLVFNAGTFDLTSSVRLGAGSKFDVNAAAFNAGYVSGSLDWQAGTVRITDTGFALGAGTPLGDLLGGDTVTVGPGSRLAADQAIVIRPAALTLADGGQFSAAAALGLGDAPLGSAQNIAVGTSAGCSIQFAGGRITATREASSNSPPFIDASLNLAQGVLDLVPSELGASPRPSLVVSGSAVNGTVRVADAPNASVLFQTLSGSATLNVQGLPTHTTARASDATFGGLKGAGGLALEGPVTIVTAVNSAFSGPLSGPGALTKAGPATLELNAGAANACTGGTRVEGGTLFLNRFPGTTVIPGALTIAPGGTVLFAFGASNEIADSADVTVQAGGVLDLAGQTETIRSLSLAGTGRTDGQGGSPAGTLTVTGTLTVFGGDLDGRIAAGSLPVTGGRAHVRGSAGSASLASLPFGGAGATLAVGGFAGQNQLAINGPFSVADAACKLQFTTGAASDPALIRATGALTYPTTGAIRVRVDQFVPQPAGTAIKLIDFGTGSSTPQLSRYALSAPQPGSGAGTLAMNGRTLVYVVARNPCPADFNGSGAADLQDIFAFLNAWFAGSPGADFDLDGQTALLDIFAFLRAWFAGC